MPISFGGGWIQDLPEPLKEKVYKKMNEKHFSDGDAIFLQGNQSDYLYEIVSGQITIRHITISGDETIVAIFGPDDCIGEQGLIDGGLRANSAYASGKVVLNRLAKKDFDTLKSEHAIITEHLLQLVSRRFRLALLMLEEGNAFPLRARLLRRLYLLARANGRPKEGESVQIVARFSQSELGQWTGYSRQSVNSIIQSLKNEGLVSWNGNVLTLLDIDSIKNELEADDLLEYSNLV